MKTFAVVLAGAAIVTTAVHAADVALSNTAIANLVSGKTFMISGGVARFGNDKSYSFSGLFTGKWRATKQSVCITFDTGDARCDRVVRNGKQIFLIDAQGGRTLLQQVPVRT